MVHAVRVVWWLLREVLGLLTVVMVLRIPLGWCRWQPWRPVGDPGLVEVMRRNSPRRPGGVCCAVIDEASPDQVVRQGFARCDATTRFELGSLTKTFTGLLLGDAFDRGELTPATTLAEVWPDLATAPAGSITMDELAHHTSGLPRLYSDPVIFLRTVVASYLGLDPYRGLSPHHVHQILRHVQIRGRGRYRYSNLGAAATGLAITKRAQAPDFAALLETRLLAPLGLEQTSARVDAPRRAGHGLLGAWAGIWKLDGYAPAGAMTSTLDDMTRYARLLLAGQVPGQRALSDGLFWQCVTTPQGLHRYWHNGQTGGYSCYLAVYPDTRRAVVILAARANANVQERLAVECVRSLPRSPIPTGISDTV